MKELLEYNEIVCHRSEVSTDGSIGNDPHFLFLFNGYYVKMERDDNEDGPRVYWDNAGVMVCTHRRYDLGDKADEKDMAREIRQHPDFKQTWDDEYKRDENGEEIYENGYFVENPEYKAIDELGAVQLGEIMDTLGIPNLALYLYDHSGLRMNTSGFSCRWDSGNVGVIYMPYKTYTDEFKGDFDKAIACLKAEVKTYDTYLSGDVYGFSAYPYIVDEDGYIAIDTDNPSDAGCWGLYGYEYALEEIKGSLSSGHDMPVPVSNVYTTLGEEQGIVHGEPDMLRLVLVIAGALGRATGNDGLVETAFKLFEGETERLYAVL